MFKSVALSCDRKKGFTETNLDFLIRNFLASDDPSYLEMFPVNSGCLKVFEELKRLDSLNDLRLDKKLRDDMIRFLKKINTIDSHWFFNWLKEFADFES